MAEKKGTGKKLSNGDLLFGPYKGSEKNGGRPIYAIQHPDGSRSSVDKARYEYEKKHGKLSKNEDVDHKDNGGRKGHDSLSNLQAMSHSENVAKENKRRAKKK